MALARFLPRNERFFEYFQKAAENAAAVARVLEDLLEDYTDVERKVRLARDLEHRGDEITHQIFDALNRTFLTPLDRDDITELTARLDDFTDAIEEVVRGFWIARIDKPTEHSRLLARIIKDQAVSLADAVSLLANARQRDHLLTCTVEIKRLESEADEVLDQAEIGLYEGVGEIGALIKAIRWGDIYQYLESATDRAEDIANTLETIVVKNV